jgi:hypothetical protein
MVERRNLFKGSHDKVPKLLEESGMRHFIAVSIGMRERQTLFDSWTLPDLDLFDSVSES